MTSDEALVELVAILGRRLWYNRNPREWAHLSDDCKDATREEAAVALATPEGQRLVSTIVAAIRQEAPADDSLHVLSSVMTALGMSSGGLKEVLGAIGRLRRTEAEMRREQAEVDAARPDDIRDDGWSVAVHNDYRQLGEPFTFWLFTKDGRAVKGEGLTDRQALDQVRAAIRAVVKEQL